jgi:serine/threonine protein kinase
MPITISDKAKTFLRNKYLVQHECFDELKTAELNEGCTTPYHFKNGSTCNGIFKVKDNNTGSFKHFWIGKKLGAGKAGSAYHAVWLDCPDNEDPEYTFKTIAKKDNLVYQSHRSAFMLELAALKKLYGDKVATPGIDETKDTPANPDPSGDPHWYIARPFTKGKHLEELEIDDPYLFLRVVQKILHGLNVLHEQSLSHGDLKLDHIYIDLETFFDENAQAQLIDFGHTGNPVKSQQELDDEKARNDIESQQDLRSKSNRPEPSLWRAKVTSLPVNYMFIPNWWSNRRGLRHVSLEDDMYVLGKLLQKKIDKSSELKKNKFLVDLCANMVSDDTNPNRLKTAKSAMDLVDDKLRTLKSDAATTITRILNSSSYNGMDYDELYLALSTFGADELTNRVDAEFEKIKAIAKLRMPPAKAAAATEEEAPERIYYNWTESKKIDLLKKAYLEIFENHLNLLSGKTIPKKNIFGNRKSVLKMFGKTISKKDVKDANALINGARHSKLIQAQRNYYRATKETTSQIKVREIVNNWAPIRSTKDKQFLDIPAIHARFLLNEQNEIKDQYKAAASAYLYITPRSTIPFTATYTWNRARHEPYACVEDFAYLGMMPSPNETRLHDTIYSVVSLVDWHEYLTPFNISTTAPEAWAKNNIQHHRVGMNDFENNLNATCFIDTLFKIAQQCKEARKADKRVYFHGKGGGSRSAMMLALVLYHQHKYLEDPADDYYTLDHAYETIRLASPHITIDNKDKKFADNIVKKLDAVHGAIDKSNLGALPAPVSVSGQLAPHPLNCHKFLWDKIMQLPALKKLLIQAQEETNKNEYSDRASCLKQLFHTKIGNTNDMGKLTAPEWYQKLQDASSTDVLYQSLRKYYADDINNLLTQINETLGIAAPAKLNTLIVK